MQGSENANYEESTITSGHNISLWVDTTLPIKYSKLGQSLETEIVIVGGGLAGLSVGYCLSKAGKKVVILEDGFLGSGETGRTTAHITNALDDRYYEIQRIHGKEAASLAAASHTSAINFIAETVNAENIDCDLQQVDGYLFPHAADENKTINKEYIATQESGLDTVLLESGAPGIQDQEGPFLVFKDQRQFHPLKYLKGLAEAIVKNGGQIYTESRVDEVSKTGVKLKDLEVKAEHIVVTTNTPFNDWVTMHTKQYAYRSYVITALIPKNSLQPALWWDTGDPTSTWISQPYHYARIYGYNDENDVLIVGGGDHKTGQADAEKIPEEERYYEIRSWAKKHFPMIGKEIYKWSGQVMEPVDALAFIGRNPGDKNIYIATGDSGNGMTHCSIAGMLLSDLILQKDNPWEKLYDPSRLMLHSLGDYLHEAGNMAAQYADFITAGDLISTKDLEAGKGAIISHGLNKIAVYKDDQGLVKAYSAICPHLGCVLQYNSDEKSFDCPCHGSRFTTEGKLINGPAMTDLKQIEYKE